MKNENCKMQNAKVKLQTLREVLHRAPSALEVMGCD